MTTAWAHLPNARLIGAMLAALEARPVTVTIEAEVVPDRRSPAARTAAVTVLRAATQGKAWTGVRKAILRRSQAISTGVAQRRIWSALWDAAVALIAWDDCAYLLDLPSDTLRTMADLCDAPACHQAVLLLPYVLVKESK